MKLSIIIPYYNAGGYTRELLKVLDKQMTEDVEVILIDDGSEIPFTAEYDWLTIKRKKNAGASSARNMGLDLAKGDYIAFIDADDLVSENYIQTILTKINEGFDYCYISWRTLPGGWDYQVKLHSVNDKFPPFNLCVWNRIYKRELIGDLRFNTKKAIAEDAEFIRKIKERGKKAYISEFLYFYRTEQRESLTAKFANGRLDMNRIVYYYQHITKDMDLVEEVKAADEYAEVIIMTTKNDLPELEEYAMIIPPQRIKGTELRGEHTKLFEKIEKPIKTQIAIFTAVTQEIGGIETWIYNFSRIMSEYYDILVLYDKIATPQLARLQKYVRCQHIGLKPIICDTLIVSRISDPIPFNIEARQTVQMVHACKMLPQWTIPQDRDRIVAVSNAVLDSFKAEGEVIYNLVDKPTRKKCLTLISATRLSKTSAFEKGHKRMLQLAEKLEQNDIPYIWLMFSDEGFKERHPNMIILPPTLDIAPYLAKADYYVSLSDAEGWGYSVIEALTNGTPVITTPVSVLPEIGFKDKEHGYIVPFNMDFDVKKLKRIPRVKFKWVNQGSIDKWREVLGDSKPTHEYNPKELTQVIITKPYFDTQIERKLNTNEIINVSQERAMLIINAGYGRRYAG